MKPKIGLGIVVLIFILSRVYVLLNPPFYKVVQNGKVTYAGYSDVQHDSERYANMWYYGLVPYRQHLFEYPPAAIPIMYLPLLVDQAHIGYYYLDYRIEIFIFECILFLAILLTVKSLPIPNPQKWLAIVFYIAAGALAKDFWYDGLDLAFIGSFTLAIIWRYRHDYRKFIHRVIFWALFWLSVAIKLLTVPLALPLFILKWREWRSELWALVAGGLIVWIIPLVLYRSSLSVFLYFHAIRPLKYEAFGAFVIRLINDFTHTEIQSKVAPNFPMIGPFSSIMEKFVGITFPLVILLVLGWAAIRLWRISLKEPVEKLAVYHWLIKISLVFIFALFLASKIFSRPFHIWYVPLITLYPFKNLKTQLIFMSCALLMITLDTTNLLAVDPKLLIGTVHLVNLRDFLRFLPMVLLLYLSVRLRQPAPDLKKG